MAEGGILYSIFYTVAFTTALLFPYLLIGGVIIGLYALLAIFLYRWNKTIFAITIVLSLAALGVYVIAVWNQYQRDGAICWGENICLDSGTGQRPIPPPGHIRVGYRNVEGKGADIDANTLTTNSPNPVITGSISGMSDMCLSIGQGDVDVPSMIAGPASMPEYIWGICSKTGAIAISDGRWSAKVNYPSGGPVLQEGIYTIAVSDWDTGSVVMTAVFVVR